MPTDYGAHKGGGGPTDYGSYKSGKSRGGGSSAKPKNFSEAVAWAKKHPGQVQHHGGWANPLTSAFHEATAMATGIPASGIGIATATKNSIENALQNTTSQLGRHAPARKPHSATLLDLEKAIEADYRYRWGPIAHGHPGEFAKRFTHTPLADIFDILTVLSAGAGAAGKLSPALRAPHTIKLRTPSGEVLERPLRGTNLSRALKTGADRSLKKILPNEIKHGRGRDQPHRGPTEWNRAGKLSAKRTAVENMRRQVAMSPYLQAAEKLDTSVPVPKLWGANKQLIASNLRQEFVTSDYVKMYAERLRAHAETARAKGDTHYADAALKEAKLLTNPKVLKWIDNPTDKMKLREKRAGGVVKFRESVMAEKGQGLTTAKDVRPYQSLLMLHGAKFAPDPLRPGEKILTAPEGQTIEGMIADIKAGLPDGREPIYQPHEMGTKPPPPAGGGQGGSVSQGPATRQNLGHLFDAGLIAFNRDLLGRGTQRLLRWAHYSDKHDSLMAAARPVDHLPAGWRYVKKKRGEKIPYTEQNVGAFQEMLDNLDPQGMDELGNEFLTDASKADEIATDASGRRLAVPEDYARRVIGEFHRDNRVLSKYFHNVTAVWRALVLNLRPAWLVNNIVGNTLLYSVQHAGRNGLRAYLSAVLEAGMGPDTLLSKILRREFTARISAKELADILPDEVLATFMGTQMPEGRLLAHTIGHRYSPARWARNLDQNYEKALRKAIADRVLSNNPRVRAFYDAMPEQTKSWMDAVRKAVAEDSTLPERVSGEINAALGDFTHMSSLERGIRNFVPFYAWYRAITLVVLKMPLDSPYRTAALAKMAQIGQETTDQWWREHGVDPESLPLYLRSVLPWGNSAFRMTGLNPYTTTPQLAGGFVTPGGGQDLLSSVNPVVFAPLIAIVKGANPAPWEKKQNTFKLGLTGYLDFLRFLPEARLLFPYKGKLSKGGGTHESEFLANMGWTKFRPDFEAIARRYNGR